MNSFDTFENGENLCLTWMQAYFKEKLSAIIVALAIVGINVI